MQKTFAERLARFRGLMEKEALDGFLVAVPENRYYLSGYEAEDLQLTESSGYLFITHSSKIVLTDFRYEEAAKQEAPDFELIIYSEGLPQTLPELFSNHKVERFGIERDYLTYKKYEEVRDALKIACPGAGLYAKEGLVEKLRVVKDTEELERIKQSLYLTESALQAIWDMSPVGMTEKDIAWAIERRIREGGGESVSFPPIVASGPNGALPHAVPTERVVKDGEGVILDLGSRLNHYCSDMTRTWFAGKPQDKLKEIYGIVRDAQLAAQEAMKAGEDTVEIDGRARSVIQKAGYGQQFGHGLGHGVGLAVHEKPGLRKQNPTILEENMVITVEPGIYLPGYGGVRLENMVRVTQEGCEILNSKHLFYE